MSQQQKRERDMYIPPTDMNIPNWAVNLAAQNDQIIQLLKDLIAVVNDAAVEVISTIRNN